MDAVGCLGDVCTLGPSPREVLGLLRERAAWFILGNHDEYMERPELLQEHSDAPVVVSAVEWCRSELGSEDREFLRGFAKNLRIDLGGGAVALFFHGSPDSNTADLLAETPVTELDRSLGGHRATVLAGGHTHLQMIRQHRGSLIVNPGSVGLPFESRASGGPPIIMPHAEYAVLEASAGRISVTLHRVELDRTELVEQARNWKQPMANYLLAQYGR